MSYQCIWCFSVYLGMATAVTRAALPCPTSVLSCFSLCLIRLRQSQKQLYHALSVYVVFYCLPGKATAVTRAALPSPTSVLSYFSLYLIRLRSHKSSSTTPYQCMWCFSVYLVRLQQSQEQRYQSYHCIVMF